MNEKALGVVEKYELEIKKTMRGRGGLVLDTDKGVKLILSATRVDRSYQREAQIVQKIKENGYQLVDTFVKNKDGGIVTEDEDCRKYIIKDWFDARDCCVTDVSDVCQCVRSLANVHKIMVGAQDWGKLPAPVAMPELSGDVPPGEEETKTDSVKEIGGVAQLKAAEAVEMVVQPVIHTSSILDDYGRHCRELKMTTNYLKNKKHKTEFEQTVYRSIGEFYGEASDAVHIMNSQVVRDRCQEAKDKGELSHGSFNYHNVAITDNGVAMANFDKCRIECQMIDLYQFMRKVLEKHDWNMELGYKMMDEYDKCKRITDEDLEVLTALFAFPEKFWKVVNRYLNGSKAWIPVKNTDKLKLVVGQNAQRKEFLATVM